MGWKKSNFIKGEGKSFIFSLTKNTFHNCKDKDGE